MPLPLDPNAQTFGLPRCMLIPIAARDEQAIEEYVGSTTLLSTRTPNKAFKVDYRGPLAERDPTLPIWDLPESDLLHARTQVWVHVNYTGYRRAFLRVLPNLLKQGQVVDHIYNRRLARLHGYPYVRLMPISRSANSSSGRGPESEWVKDYGTFTQDPELEATRVEHADPADIVKMLNIETGPYPLGPVGQALRLMYPQE